MKAKSEEYCESESFAAGRIILPERVEVIGVTGGGCIDKVSGMFGGSSISKLSILMFALFISMVSSMTSVLSCTSMSLIVGCNQLSVKFGGRVISFGGGKLDLFGRDMVDGDCVGEGFFLLFK